MQLEPDQLAGVVDLFGGLTPRELRGALIDLAARHGEPLDQAAVEGAIDRAVEGYYLVTVEEAATPPGEPLLAAGPTALPTLPPGGEDLPHILGIERRELDPETVGQAAVAQLRADAASAVDDGDEERIATLLDVCYDLEAWGPVETAALRERLDAVR